MQTSRLSSINLWLARRRKLAVLSILICSIIVRGLYYSDLSSGPLLHQHRWTQSDMSYFDRWAKAIAAGDWLSRDVDPPLHTWMRSLADEYYSTHPGELPPPGPGESPDAARQRGAVEIWKKWIGPHRFFQEPLYPYLVAVTYRLFGEDVRYVFLWQLILGTVLNLLIYLIARRVFGDLTGIIAAAFAVSYSPMLLYELILLRDSAVAFMSVLLAWLLLRAAGKGRFPAWAMLGFACGVAMMLKSHFVVAVLFAAAAMCFTLRANRRVLIRSAVAYGGFLLIGLSPLVVRNLMVGVSPFAAAGNAAGTIIITNAVDAGVTEWGLDHFVEIQERAQGRMIRTSSETLGTHPSAAHYLALVWSKFDAAWHWYEHPSNENFYYYRMHSATLRWLPFTYYTIAPLGLIGLFLAASRFRRSWPLYLPVLVNLPVLVIFFVQARYRVALAAGLIPFAAFAVYCTAVSLLERRRLRSILLLLSAFLLTLWTGRSLPPGVQPMRPADFAAPFEYYYGPRITQAQAAGDLPRAVAIFEEALIHRPEIVRDFAPGQFARSAGESRMMGMFSQIYGSYARLLSAAGKKSEAQAAASLSAELSRAAQPGR